MSSEIYGSFLIPADRLADLEKAVKKLARRIENGKTVADFAPTIEMVRETVKVNGDKVEPYYWVTLHYQQPMIEGWHLIAVYDWEVTPDGERVCYTSPVPGQMVLPEFREVEPGRCDHCNIHRARKKAMLITKNFLEYMVVGTSCIKDFLGHASAQSFSELFTFNKIVTDIQSAGYSGEPMAFFNVEKVVTVASMFVQLEGFISAQNFDPEKVPTGVRVCEWFNNLHPNAVPSSEDHQFANDAIAHIRQQNFASDYIENVAKALDAQWITAKRIPLVASIAGVWKRENERRAAAEATLNEYLGNVKERLRGLCVTIERVRYTEGMYGTTSIITMRDNEGRAMVWFASGYHDPEPGAVWTVDGTVKDHNEFNGKKQTVLTRVKYTEKVHETV